MTRALSTLRSITPVELADSICVGVICAAIFLAMVMI